MGFTYDDALKQCEYTSDTEAPGVQESDMSAEGKPAYRRKVIQVTRSVAQYLTCQVLAY